MLLVILLPFHALSAWQLDNRSSHLSFTSIKNENIAENHYFKKLSGNIKNNELKINIDLSSIESFIPIRNERMKKVLFNVKEYASAHVHADLNRQLGQIKEGQQMLKSFPVELTLHGNQHTLKLDLFIVKTATQLFVSSAKAVNINSQLYGLDTGIELLRKIAGLKSIAMSVPVTFNLVFNKQ